MKIVTALHRCAHAWVLRFTGTSRHIAHIASMATLLTLGLSHHRLLKGHRRHQGLHVRSPAGAVPELTMTML